MRSAFLSFLPLTVVLGVGAATPAWISGSSTPIDEKDYKAFFEDRPAPVLRRTFDLASVPTSARVTVASPGMVDVVVNGARVTSTALPAWTETDSRVLSYAYDVTRQLTSGKNTLELRLGNGWWNLLPMKMWNRYNLRENLPQGEPCVWAELVARTAEGETRLVTDGTWQAAEGPVLRNSLYLGETFDARRTPSAWGPARVVSGPKGAVVPADDMPPVTVYKTWTAQEVTSPRPGVCVVDFGENFAGNVRFAFRGGTAGSAVDIVYGELLNGDGSVNVMTTVAGQQKKAEPDPPGLACQHDRYVFADGADCMFEPRFTFHAFRYAEIRGLAYVPSTNDFTALAYSADVRDAAGFACSNEKLNRVREMCRRTFRSNLQGVQSDCPARERFGYAGDLAVSAESLILNYGMQGFYRKVLRDRVHSADRSDGVFPSISPNAFPKRVLDKVAMGWAVDVPIVADLLLRYYGDREIVAEVYPALARFLDLCERSFKPGEVPPCLGDHEALEAGEPRLAAMAHYHRFLVLTVKFARLLGRADDAVRYLKTAGELEGIFETRARSALVKGVFGRGHQSDPCFALYHRMLSPEYADAVYEKLRQDVVAHGCALSTGIFGTQYLLEILTERGDWELAGKVATHEGFPGWFNMLDSGATTVWETWARSENVYSHNHPMFGSIAGWMMRGILGIKVCEDAVGCDRVRIEPHPIPGVTSASGWLDTPKGRIEVSWKLIDGVMQVEKRVPAGITVVGEYSDMTVDVSALSKNQAFLCDLVLSRVRERTLPSKGGRTLAVDFALDPSLAGDRARVTVANGRASVRGGRTRALVAGAGKLLRAIRYGNASFRLEDGTYAFEPVSGFRQCYMARHFENWYHRASPDELVRYIEDMALWGINAFKTQLVYPDVDAAKASTADRAAFDLGSVAMGDAFARLDVDLTVRGGCNVAPADMPAAYRAVPNKEPWRGTTEFNVCPEVPGARDYLLRRHAADLERLRRFPFNSFCYWPFDEGGCACGKCAPWGGNGYVRLIEDYHRQNDAASSKALHIVSTWLFKDEDWQLFYKYLEKQDWITHLLVDSHGDFPRYPLEHPLPKNITVVTFPEISMWGRFPWGGTGANPLPARFERLFRQASGIARGFQLYSEGLFEDVNKMVVNGLYVDPETTAEKILAEYAAWELPGCSAKDFAEMVRCLEAVYQTRVEGRGLTRGNSISYYLEHAPAEELARRAEIAARAAELAERIDRTILPLKRSCWRWRLLYLRAKIDAVVYATRNLRDPRVLAAYNEMITLYHAERQANGLLTETHLGFTCPPIADANAWLRPEKK